MQRAPFVARSFKVPMAVEHDVVRPCRKHFSDKQVMLLLHGFVGYDAAQQPARAAFDQGHGAAFGLECFRTALFDFARIAAPAAAAEFQHRFGLPRHRDLQREQAVLLDERTRERGLVEHQAHFGLGHIV